MDNSIRYKKIGEGDVPTPDYKIRLGFQNIYVEVKQFDKNDDDEKLIKNFQEDKHAGRCESTDKRIRKK
ncbi:MAG: hypothetical protein JXB49_21955 [Bacteroidales bacterium]|nr:hypothetical protein [Bacteroidales bacterium]